jgi:L-fuconolactonase
MITDAQIHLWPPNSAARPWAEGAKPDVDPPLTAERFIAIMDAVGVSRAVISPPGVSGYDSSYALECAARYPRRFAVTSRWNLDDPNNPGRIATWLRQPGMIGIRLGLVGANRQRWAESGELEAFWSAAERHAIPLMVFSPGSVVEIAAAARAHPALKLVVDHANLTGSTPDTLNTKANDLIALAPFPNVGVKLGALPIQSATRYPFADLHPLLRRIYDAFGAKRLMWASDQTTTMARDKASYLENLDLVRRAALGFVPSEDMEWILGRTVSEWFNWPME